MTGVSTLGKSLDQMSRLKNVQAQLSKLQTQMVTHKKTDSLKGLGTDLMASTRSRANLQKLETYMNNIDTANRRIKMMELSLSETRQQMGNVTSAITIQTQQGEIEKDSIEDIAGKVMAFLTDLFNEKDGDRYLFAGADSMTKPLQTTSTLQTYNKTRIDEWTSGTLSTEDLIKSYHDRTQMNDTIMGYSAALTDGNAKNVYVRVEDHTEIDMTVLANNSAMRDLLAATSVLQALCGGIDQVSLKEGDPITTVTPPGATPAEQKENFFKIFNDLAATINNALDRLDVETFKLSNTQAQMTQIKNNHVNEKATLQNTVGDIEDVDLNEVVLKIQSLMTQLDASYSVTATLSSLSLVNYLR